MPTFLGNGSLGESKGEMKVSDPNIRMGYSAEIEVSACRGLQVDILDLEGLWSLPKEAGPNDAACRAKQSRLAMLSKIYIPDSLEPHESVGLLLGPVP